MMEDNTILDYAELRVSFRHNRANNNRDDKSLSRCDLVVSAGEATEDLASGLSIKPLISHSNTLKGQIAQGSHVIRLEAHPGKSSWFTKGTLKRFIHYVSAPEILERVNAIEGEIIQLQKVRDTPAKLIGQNEDMFRVINEIYYSSTYIQAVVDGGPPNSSKKKFMLAWDEHMKALLEEQRMAFLEAYAAKFNTRNVADLMAFAQKFEANHLVDACTQFLTLSKKRMSPKEDGNMSQDQDCVHKGTSPRTRSNGTVSSNKEVKDAFCRNNTVKRWEMLDNILSGNINRMQANPVNEGVPGTERYSLKPNFMASQSYKNSEPQGDINGQGIFNKVINGQDLFNKVIGKAKEVPEREPIGKHTQNDKNCGSQGANGKIKLNEEVCKATNLQEKEPMRRQCRSEKNCESEDANAEGNTKESQEKEPTRRLSVQAVISLFESKKDNTKEVVVKSPRTDKPALRFWNTTYQPRTYFHGQETTQGNSLGKLEATGCGDITENVTVPLDHNIKKRSSKDIIGSLGTNKPALGQWTIMNQNKTTSQDQGNSQDNSPEITIEATRYGDATNSLTLLVNHKTKNQSSVKELSESQWCLMDQTKTGSQAGESIEQNHENAAEATRSGNVTNNIISPLEHHMENQTTTKGLVRSPRTDKQTLKRWSIINQMKTDYQDVATIQVETFEERAETTSGRDIMNNTILPMRSSKELLRGPRTDNPPPRLWNTNQPKNGFQTLQEKSYKKTVRHASSGDDIHHTRLELNGALTNAQETKRKDTSEYAVSKEETMRKGNSVSLPVASVNPALIKVMNSIAKDTISEKFYEQYSKLRDAKLRNENPREKATREAKLRLMQETYEIKKAEMEKRMPRAVKPDFPHPHAKLQSKCTTFSPKAV